MTLIISIFVLVMLIARLPAFEFATHPYIYAAQAILYKALGRGPHCPWSAALDSRAKYRELRDLGKVIQDGLHPVERDPAIGAVRLLAPTHGRQFWIRDAGHDMDGPTLLAYLIADHERLVRTHRNESVHAGDVVIDCGAHVGVFTSVALQQGASKVIAIEPDPTNLECLKRNFSQEIARKQVIVIPKGAWDTEGTLRLSQSAAQSGRHSIVTSQGNQGVMIPVTTIDRIVEELDLQQVNFVKMDIEGAERHALAGARRSLSTFGPRLMLDSYHLPDDPVVLRDLLTRCNARYRAMCKLCDVDRNELRLLPHVIFWTVP